jgi:hypothetical protein
MMDLAGLYTTLFGQPHLAGRFIFRRLAFSLQPSALSAFRFLYLACCTLNQIHLAGHLGLRRLALSVLRSSLSILLLQHAARQLITGAYAFICH